MESTACGLLKTPQASCHPWTNWMSLHNSFKRRNGSNRYTHIKIMSVKGYFIDTINPGGDNLYTADQICRMVSF